MAQDQPDSGNCTIKLQEWEGLPSIPSSDSGFAYFVAIQAETS
jgi:hypothetical protein